MVMRYMIINRAALKAEARACMRQSRTSPYLTALVYAVVTFIISQLNGRLLFPSDLVHYVLDLEEGRMWLYIAPEYYTRLYTEPFAYLLAFLLQVAGAMLGAGMVIFCLHAARREENSVWNLVDGFSHFLRLIALNLLEGLFVFLWSLLFIIPGIVAAYRYRLAIYLLLEHPEMRVMDCIRESKRLMYGRKGELFILDLSFLGWYLLTIIPFASVYVTPYIQTTRAGYYLAVISIDSQHDSRGRFGREDGRQDYREPWE